MAAIEAFPLRPTLLIDSGGGYQCYWLFREPVHLAPAGGDARPMIFQLEGINRGLSLALGGDVAASDAARILRLPGTFNMKLSGQPRPVKVIWCEPDRVFDLAELAKYEDKTRTQQQGPRHGQQTSTAPGAGGEYTKYAQKALAAELAVLARTPEGSRNARLNQAAFALGQLVGAGVLDRGSVEAGLGGVAAVIGLGEAETRTTIKSGLDRGISEPRTLPEKAQGRRNGPGQGG
jgi:putative DNA primase/helicase